MQRKPVNRFTFDAHSVLLFSALALSGPLSASPSHAQRMAQASATTHSAAPSQSARPALPTVLAERSHDGSDKERTAD
ncbi:hypothetical protein [Lampropedia cohaerens]|nr:hypothetical protein [Lampropedia cohaerens]